MALLKTKTLPNGTEVSYWKWLDQNKSRHFNRAHYTLGGWKDKGARDAYPDNPLTSENFDWTGEDYPFTLSELNKSGYNDEKVAYQKVKESKIVDEVETNWFADAVDA